MAPTHPPTTATTKTKFSACTNFNDEELHLTWTIHNFSVHQEDTGVKIKSPVLTSANGLKWHLTLYPKVKRKDKKDYVSLYLHFLSSSDPAECPQVKFQFTILNAEQDRVGPLSLRYCREIKYHKFKRPGVGFGNPNFVKRDDLIGFLKNDPLTIGCEFTIRGNRIDTILQIPACTLPDDLESSFRDQNAGDTIIEVDGKEFLVYKGILQARSPVFAAMFQHHQMEEQVQNRVIITDFQPEVVEEMLIYIYTGKSPNVQAMAIDLLSIADKYNLDRLKFMSADVLSRKLTHENAIETLILADLYNVCALKKFVINFITTNCYFRETSIWEKTVSLLSTQHPKLLTEMICALFALKK